jgi:hypothetical protein
MHPNQSSDDLKMAELFGPDIHQQVSPTKVVDTVPALDGVLHRGSELAVWTAKLLQEHIPEPHIGLANIHGVH